MSCGWRWTPRGPSDRRGRGDAVWGCGGAAVKELSRQSPIGKAGPERRPEGDGGAGVGARRRTSRHVEDETPRRAWGGRTARRGLAPPPRPQNPPPGFPSAHWPAAPPCRPALHPGPGSHRHQGRHLRLLHAHRVRSPPGRQPVSWALRASSPRGSSEIENTRRSHGACLDPPSGTR